MDYNVPPNPQNNPHSSGSAWSDKTVWNQMKADNQLKAKGGNTTFSSLLIYMKNISESERPNGLMKN